MRDQMNDNNIIHALSPVSVADNTAQVSAIIDTAGYDALTFSINLGSIADADATFAVLIEDGAASDLSDNATVAAGNLIGTVALAGFQFDTDNLTRKIAYKGAKRYVRMTITPSANTSAALMSVVAILGFPLKGPVTNPYS